MNSEIYNFLMESNIYFDHYEAMVNGIEEDDLGYSIEIQSPVGYCDSIDVPKQVLDDWIENNVMVGNEEKYHTVGMIELDRDNFKPERTRISVDEMIDDNLLNMKDLHVFIKENVRLQWVSLQEFHSWEQDRQDEYVKAWRYWSINNGESCLPAWVFDTIKNKEEHYDGEDPKLLSLHWGWVKDYHERILNDIAA